jgi:RNA polymerase sigma-70 factor (ECF subfamily)
MPAMTDLITDSRFAGAAASPPDVGPADHEISADRRQEFEKMLPSVLPRFRSIATHWLGNREDAEDAVQDAMLSAFKHITSFNGRAKLSTWLTAIVINAIRMQIRRRPRARLLSMDYSAKEGQPSISDILIDRGPTPEKAVERLELYELAMKLTRRLPPSQRGAMRLRYEADFSLKKASRKLGVPTGTLKAQLARGRVKLAERFRDLVGKPKIQGAAIGTKRWQGEANEHRLCFLVRSDVGAARVGGCL